LRGARVVAANAVVSDGSGERRLPGLLSVYYRADDVALAQDLWERPLDLASNRKNHTHLDRCIDQQFTLSLK